MNTRLFLITLTTLLALARSGSGQNLLPAAGNVGIGTTSPQAALDVRGSARVAGDLVLGDPSLSTRSLTAVMRLDISSGPNEHIFLNRLGQSGDVFVGDTGHLSNLRVSGKTSTTTLELTSDRNQKRDFQAVSPGEILARIAALPISSWTYTNSPGVRHLGPTAQDFKAAFPDLGEDDRHIGAGDGIGVALAAIKDLHRTVARQAAEVRDLERELRALRRSMAARPESAVTGQPIEPRDDQPTPARSLATGLPERDLPREVSE